MDDVGLLDQDELAAELGLDERREPCSGFGASFESDLEALQDIGAGERRRGLRRRAGLAGRAAEDGSDKS